MKVVRNKIGPYQGYDLNHLNFSENTIKNFKIFIILTYFYLQIYLL